MFPATASRSHTGLMFRVKATHSIILHDLRDLAETQSELARRERDTLHRGI